MRIVDLLHRWSGGIIGLLLAVLGLSGAILVHRDSWIWLPHTGDPQRQDVATLAGAIARGVIEAPQSILFASREFGLNRLYFPEDAGAYADQSGAIVTRWSSVWDRPETWLFDLHHHLLTGDTGEIVAGIAGLVGIAFVITGTILWWRTRRTFALRLVPARFTRPAILRHHRDLGVVMAPLLLLSMLTGAMMVLKPVSALLLSPWSSAATMQAASAPPKVTGGPLAADLDWRAMLTEARRRFPDGEVRVLSLPRKPGDLIALRMRQRAEWLPNGRTTLWFAPESGRLIAARDALALPAGSRIFNTVYPLHAAKVGGLAYELVMTASGLTLAMLGSFTVWSFWFRRKPGKRAKPAGVVASAAAGAQSLRSLHRG